ncbi:alpha/beta fold hydrolase [Streptomyces sp. NPDC049577]|uniref:alpha/beta fold hydrolase n=1 Tax=Streptomyces sp. NPDC049577 TaxID=3155153 RepID=UPI003422138D
MTAFVLVPGAHTGGWIWGEVATRLRESGAEAHPVTLTGMGDRRHLAGPQTELDTHVEDVVQVIDHLDAAEVVLVGHCYGVHPALGAAARRPERISRIVYLDSGMPQHGAPALATLPPGAARIEEAEDGWLVPAPSSGEWQRWGSTAGVPEEALERMSRLAAPQPLGTLTQPLRLTEALAKVPTTGVLCTANGASIETLEALVRFGDPHLKALTDPAVSFFELHTGHWPMLSAPTELADALLGAAAGEGHRITASAEQPPRSFLLDVPERPRERHGHVDLYLPDAEEPRPAIVFVHGGPVPAESRPTPRDWEVFTGYGRYAASLGAVGVTLDHRLHDLGGYGDAAEDVAAAVDLVRADPRVDADRVALWFFSGGGLLSAQWLAAAPPWLRCVAATYAVLAPLPNWGRFDARFHPVEALRTPGGPPVVLSRVELERPEIAATVEEFLTAAGECGAPVEVIDVPLGHHGFETMDHTDGTRRAVEHAMLSVLGHLGG